MSQLEALANNDALTLQRMWHFLQPSLRVLEPLAALADTFLSRLPVGGELLNCLHTASATTADSRTQAMLTFLLQQVSSRRTRHSHFHPPSRLLALASACARSGADLPLPPS